MNLNQGEGSCCSNRDVNRGLDLERAFLVTETHYTTVGGREPVTGRPISEWLAANGALLGGGDGRFFKDILSRDVSCGSISLLTFSPVDSAFG